MTSDPYWGYGRPAPTCHCRRPLVDLLDLDDDGDPRCVRTTLSAPAPIRRPDAEAASDAASSAGAGATVDTRTALQQLRRLNRSKKVAARGLCGAAALRENRPRVGVVLDDFPAFISALREHAHYFAGLIRITKRCHRVLSGPPLESVHDEHLGTAGQTFSLLVTNATSSGLRQRRSPSTARAGRANFFESATPATAQLRARTTPLRAFRPRRVVVVVSSRPKAQEAPASVREAGPEWVRLWYSTLDTLIAQETWRPEQRSDLEAYVNAARLARYHREQAEGEPYTVHAESGRVFAHPGFNLARDAQREQRALADALVLTPAARRAEGVADMDSEWDDLDRLVSRRDTRRSGLRPPSPDLPEDLDEGSW